MYHKKCRGKVRAESAYSTDSYVNLVCIACGENWDLDLQSSSAGGVFGRFIYKSMIGVSNGK